MPTAKEIAEMKQGWLESSDAFEARREKLLDEAIKSGEAGKIAPDPELTKNLDAYRQKQPERDAVAAVKQVGKDALMNRKREAKDFQLDSANNPKEFTAPTHAGFAKHRKFSMWKPERHRLLDQEAQTSDIFRRS